MPAYAREEIRLALRKRVEALVQGYRQNVGITGPLGVGKSYLLCSAFREFSRQPKVTCIYISAEAFDYQQLAERWLGAVLTGYLSSLGEGEHLRLDLPGLCERLEKQIPKTVQTVQQIRRAGRKERADEFVQKLFSLTRILSDESGRKIVLMIDEFQELERLPVPDPFALLGREIMVQTDTLYLVSCSKPERAREIFRDKLSLLFGNFEVIQLRPFNFEETVAFVGSHFPKTQFSPQQNKFFITLTNGEPLYLDLLMDRLRFYLSSHADQMVSDQLIFLAFQEELLDHRGRLALLFEKMLHSIPRVNRENTPYLKTLLAAAEGHHRVSQLASDLNKTISETKKVLQRLVHEDRIGKNGTFYFITDPLFRFWLREVFKRRSYLCAPEHSSVGEDLYEALREWMEKIRHEEKKEVTVRIEALFKEFRNDIIEMDGKKLRLPQFTDVLLRTGHGRFTTLTAKNTKTRWICQIASSQITEEDVFNYMDETKRLRKRVQKKILIGLRGIEQNAKLLAQSQKIHLWSLRDLNSVLDLYDMPKVMMYESRGNDETPLGTVEKSLPAAKP